MGTTRRDFIKTCLLFGGTLIFRPKTLLAGKGAREHWEPAYLSLEKKGRFKSRVEESYAILEECHLCPRECGVNRLEGEKGFCQAPLKPMVFSANPHFGEEISLVGQHGSGTIFFSNCNLRCVFCQNWPIAIEGKGKVISDEDLANMMLYLQKIGCHNINLVTPTHVMPNILSATRIASQKGLHIPLVYNTSGYEKADIIRLLDGIVDIYLPDMKFFDGKEAAKYSSGADDYPELSQNAILEMQRQVGEHRVDDRGIALRGLMIRHLVMPNRVAGTKKFVKWIAEKLPKSTYVNIMPQYHVDYKAYDYPKIARGITVQEFLEAMDWADQYNLTNLDPKSVSVRKFYAAMHKN